MRRVRGERHSERERHPNGEGSSHLGSDAGAFACGDPGGLGPPPGAPIRTAWIAGRIGLAFVDESGGGGDLGNFSSVPVRIPDNHAGHLHAPHHVHHSLTALEALDVNDRPFIWDL